MVTETCAEKTAIFPVPRPRGRERAIRTPHPRKIRWPGAGVPARQGAITGSACRGHGLPAAATPATQRAHSL